MDATSFVGRARGGWASVQADKPRAKCKVQLHNVSYIFFQSLHAACLRLHLL